MMANIILDNLTINIPVADLTELATIPTANLQEGVVCYVISKKRFYTWSGSDWVLEAFFKQNVIPTYKADTNFTADYGIDYLLSTAGGSPMTITLPSPTIVESHVNSISFKKISNDVHAIKVQVANPAAESIDGADSYTFTQQWSYLEVYTDKFDWYIR